jgi:recombination protein RecR
MAKLPKSIEKLINEFSKLPGIGHKTASRLTFYLLKKSDLDLELFSEAVANLKKEVLFCSICHNMAENDPCLICSDPNRDQNTICVVEETLDAQALDQTGQYKGVFHILGGVLNPLEGIGPEQLNIDSLIKRLESGKVTEVILATNPSLEGETTAMQLMRQIKPLGLKVTRLARGLPIGGDLEYADEITILRALEGRSEYQN